MVQFDLEQYSETVKQLLQENRQSALGPGTPNPAARPLLEAATSRDVAPQAPNPEFAACCLSGLWLWHDFLEESHEISQDLHSSEGSFWHGIMHRREPDYSNAKYWFRRVGDHAIFPDLLSEAKLIGQSLASQSLASGSAPELRRAENLLNQPNWDPFEFVDLCAEASRNTELVPFCREVATTEWRLLFNHCYGK